MAGVKRARHRIAVKEGRKLKSKAVRIGAFALVRQEAFVGLGMISFVFSGDPYDCCVESRLKDVRSRNQGDHREV